MKTRLRILAFAASASVFATAGSSSALEKVTRAAVDGPDSDWRGGASCAVQYYNICTGWLWVWSGFDAGDRVGQLTTTCCSPSETGSVIQASMFWATGAPAGYDFTGTVDLWNADANGCPTGGPLGSLPLLPVSNTFMVADFSSSPVTVPTDFLITYTFGPLATLPTPAAFGTEHPAAGPTGPQACGTCYPNDRTNRSFYYATAASPLCPGTTFNDGVCDAQLLWSVTLACLTTSVDESSWGQIKNLYR